MYHAESNSERNDPLLRIDGLTKRFGDKAVLTDIELSVFPATLTVILGPAGAGKTTLLRVIAGLEHPDTGKILLSGRDAVGIEPKDRDVAMIFDNLALYPNKTGYENIASPLMIRREPKEKIEQKVAEIAATLKISYILKRLPKTMSGGERQRIALGRALIRNPKLFLLDEPLSSLDAQLRIELRAELKRLQRDLGHTFLLATPDFQEAMAVADIIVMLRQGHIVQSAPPQEIYVNPVDREVARFVGSPQINLVRAQVVSNSPDGEFFVCGTRLKIPAHLAFLMDSGLNVCELGIRPENLKIVEQDTGEFKVQVTDIEPLGFKSVLTVQAGDEEMRLIMPNNQVEGLSVGQDIGVSMTDPTRLLAFGVENGYSLTAK